MMRARLAQYVEQVVAELAAIPEKRKRTLEQLAQFVRDRHAAQLEAKLTFICTHNSRRSHFAQIWAATAAAYYRVDGIATYSAGTEATAFDPRAVAAIERAGFCVENRGGPNPRYRVSYGTSSRSMECFSKKIDDPANPSEGFAAVMTCAQADQACPLVQGAAFRIAIPYDDPKRADGSPGEAITYDERCRQIATEMFSVFSRVAA